MYKCPRCKIERDQEWKIIKHILEHLCPQNAQFYYDLGRNYDL